MTKIPSPEELKKLRIIIPTARLVLWAESLGFETRKTGGSHIVCRHTEHPDIFFTIVHDTSKLDSKRNLADAYIALRKRTMACKDSFESSNEDQLDAIKNKLPDYIDAEQDHESGQIVLRDRNLPQLGLTLQTGEDRILENKIRYLEDLKREALAMMGRARTNFDIGIKFSHGVFDGHLSHTVYRNLPKMDIPPYRANDPIDKLFTAVQGYIATVEERDMEYEVRLEDALSSPSLKTIQIAFNARRGERINKVQFESPKDGSLLNLEFTTKSNQRASTTEISGRISGAQLQMVERTFACLQS